MLFAPAFCLYMVYCHPPFRESDEHSISGAVHGSSARVPCLCSSSCSLSEKIGLKLAIAYRSYRCTSGQSH